MKPKNNFLLHGGILAATSILVRLIGMIYRIPMVNIIGREGSGYYSNAYSVYSILLLLSSYSLPLAVSKMVSARVSVGKWKETGRVMAVALVFACVTGLLFGLLTYFGADFLCTSILKSPMSARALKFMAPTVFIMAVLGVLRGFFQGLQTTIPTAVSQLLEQIINALVSVGMASVLFRYGVKISGETGKTGIPASLGAAGGTIGTGAGAFAALLFFTGLFFLFNEPFGRRIRSDRHEKVRSVGKLFRILVLTAVPVILSTAAYNCIDIIDASVFNHRMAKLQMAESEYIGIWGDYSNAYLLLIHLPVSMASAIASALVPSLAAAHAAGDRKEVRKKLSLTFAVTAVLAIPCAFGLSAIGGNLAHLLFNDVGEEAGKYLIVGGAAVIFYSLSTVTNAILQGLDRMRLPMIHAFIALGGHVVLLLLLLYLFDLGIYAVILSYMAFSLTMMILNMRSIYRLTGFLPDPLRHIIIPVGGSVVIVIICFAVTYFVTAAKTGRTADLLIVLFSLILSTGAYLLIVLLLGVFTPSQLANIPGGKTFARIADILHPGRK